VKVPRILDRQAEPIPDGEGIVNPLEDDDDDDMIYEAVICEDQTLTPDIQEAQAVAEAVESVNAYQVVEMEGSAADVRCATATPFGTSGVSARGFTQGKKQIML
jgi:hypothetical protein